MIRSRIRAARPLRGRALPTNGAGLWNPIETRKALLICVANQRVTTLAGSPKPKTIVSGRNRRRFFLSQGANFEAQRHQQVGPRSGWSGRESPRLGVALVWASAVGLW